MAHSHGTLAKGSHLISSVGHRLTEKASVSTKKLAPSKGSQYQFQETLKIEAAHECSLTLLVCTRKQS
eukprot:1161224-Pelagomonas_calceolata.AAC.9